MNNRPYSITDWRNVQAELDESSERLIDEHARGEITREAMEDGLRRKAHQWSQVANEIAALTQIKLNP